MENRIIKRTIILEKGEGNMELKQYLRMATNTKIRPFFIKDKCEVCENGDNLHLHHLKHFHTIVYEALKALGLEEKDTNDYTEEELRLVTSVVLGEHLHNEYLTLCNDCHEKVHDEDWKDITCNKVYYEKRRRKQELERELYNKNVLTPYLDSIVGEKLLKQQQQELIEKIDYRVNGRQRKSHTILSRGLKEFGIGYIIESKRTSRIVNGKKKYVSYWQVKKLLDISNSITTNSNYL